MEYTIAVGNDQLELAQAVNKLIKQGWKPHGGVSVAVDRNGDFTSVTYHVFAQAMILEK